MLIIWYRGANEEKKKREEKREDNRKADARSTDGRTKKEISRNLNIRAPVMLNRYQAVNETIDQAINQATNQPTNQPTKHTFNADAECNVRRIVSRNSQSINK